MKLRAAALDCSYKIFTNRTQTQRPAAASQKSTCDCNYGAAGCGLWAVAASDCGFRLSTNRTGTRRMKNIYAAAQWKPQTAIKLEHEGLLLQTKSLLVIVVMELQAVGCGQWRPWTAVSSST